MTIRTPARGCLIAAALALLLGIAAAQPARLVRATELRQDKLPSALVLRPLSTGATLEVLSLEGDLHNHMSVLKFTMR